jgi:excisionase family DNA binding protein
MIAEHLRREEAEAKPMSGPERWHSLEEIAEHLGVSQDTIHRWIRTKQMPAHKVGRLWKFDVAEVNDWVKSGKAGRKEQE